MDSIGELAEWKTYMLKKNKLNANGLLSVVASELLTDDKWKSRTVVHQIAEQRYSLANDELKMGNIYYCTLGASSLVLMIYDMQKGIRWGNEQIQTFHYIYKWKNERDGIIKTDYGSTRLVKEWNGLRRSPTSNIFNSKRWVSVYPKSYQFINWQTDPFEVKS